MISRGGAFGWRPSPALPAMDYTDIETLLGPNYRDVLEMLRLNLVRIDRWSMARQPLSDRNLVLFEANRQELRSAGQLAWLLTRDRDFETQTAFEYAALAMACREHLPGEVFDRITYAFRLP